MMIFNSLIISVLQITKIRMKYPVTLLSFGLGCMYSSFCAHRSVNFSKGNVCESKYDGLTYPFQGKPSQQSYDAVMFS